MDSIDHALKLVLESENYKDLEKVCKRYNISKKDYVNMVLGVALWDAVAKIYREEAVKDGFIDGHKN